MWPAIHRTRRRLGLAGDAAPSAPSTPAASGEAGSGGRVTPDDALLVLGRPELDRLGNALVTLLGPATVRPDTPARLEAALDAATVRLGGGGRAEVDRRPAGLYTPEAWQVRLTGVEPSIVAAVRDASREGSFRR
jgi:hypothetical protein